jgi:hypothetical protein
VFASPYVYFFVSYGIVLAFLRAVPPPRLPGYAYGYIQLIAVLVSAWGGFGPGILASITWVVLVPHLVGQSPVTWEPGRLAFQITVGLLVSWIGQRRRRAEAALRQANDNLEQRVSERGESRSAQIEVNIGYRR